MLNPPPASADRSSADPIAVHMVPWVRKILLTFLISNLAWLPLPLVTSNTPINWAIGLTAGCIPLAGTVYSLRLLRHGGYRRAVLITSFCLLIATTIAMIGWGFRSGPNVLVSVVIAIMLAALLTTQRAVLLVAGLATLIVVAIVLLEQYFPAATGFASVGSATNFITIATFILSVVIIAAFLFQFSRSLREALEAALARQEELELYRDQLEAQVRTRTLELSQANVELQHLAQQLSLQNQELLGGLELAREIQMGLLPHTIPWDRQQLNVYSYSVPAFEVGGDFYTYAALDSQRMVIVIGDISGKGVSAALVMSLTLSLIEDRIHQISDPGALLTVLNAQLTPRLQHNGMNAALLCMIIDTQHQTIAVANAGMLAPTVVRQNRAQFIDVVGLPVGSVANLTYETVECTLLPGDLIVLMSDGVVEAQNAQRELFGFARLEQALQPLAVGTTPEQVVTGLLTRVNAFMGPAKQHDDITIVAMQLNSPSD